MTKTPILLVGAKTPSAELKITVTRRQFVKMIEKWLAPTIHALSAMIYILVPMERIAPIIHALCAMTHILVLQVTNAMPIMNALRLTTRIMMIVLQVTNAIKVISMSYHRVPVHRVTMQVALLIRQPVNWIMMIMV